MNKEPTNRIREEWENKLRNKWETFSVVNDYYENADIRLNSDRIADFFILEISELLKSQAEQLEGIYGFSPDDWEKKKQELLKSQKEEVEARVKREIEGKIYELEHDISKTKSESLHELRNFIKTITDK